MRTIIQRYPNKSIILAANVPASEKTPVDESNGSHPWLSEISVAVGVTAGLWFLYTSGFFDAAKRKIKS